MVNVKTGIVFVIGFLMLISGLSLWVLGDTVTSTIPLSMASTGIQWAPLLWLSGIIVILSSALANTLRFKNYLVWIVILIGGYLTIFGVLVLIASNLLP